MTIATLRPDGWPQATTVGYVSEGLDLYFLCGPNSQKAHNLAVDDRVWRKAPTDRSSVALPST
ncbi:MAG: pyridoxamine 5'-phosphate oxidase family protein [Bradyrhizobium sp.]